MKIKKWEVIFSIIIVCVMLVIGIAINDSIEQSMYEKYEIYDSALKINNDAEMFQHGMSVNAGNAFVYGELKALDPVSSSKIEGEYAYLQEEKQQYTRHERIVQEEYKDSEGKTHTRTKTEEYWEWDTVEIQVNHATKIIFLSVEFSYDKIPFPAAQCIRTVQTGYHKRSIFYGTTTTHTGTIYTSLKNDTINETKFYNNKNIVETIDSLESGWQRIVFWVIWILLIVVIVLLFYYAENNKLD